MSKVDALPVNKNLKLKNNRPDALSDKGAVEEDINPKRPPLQELDDLGKTRGSKPQTRNTYQAEDEITPG